MKTRTLLVLACAAFLVATATAQKSERKNTYHPAKASDFSKHFNQQQWGKKKSKSDPSDSLTNQEKQPSGFHLPSSSASDKPSHSFSIGDFGGAKAQPTKRRPARNQDHEINAVYSAIREVGLALHGGNILLTAKPGTKRSDVEHEVAIFGSLIGFSPSRNVYNVRVDPTYLLFQAVSACRSSCLFYHVDFVPLPSSEDPRSAVDALLKGEHH